MRFGQLFHEQSVAQWAPYNIDYDELKLLIKTNTTRQSGQAIAVPGQPDTKLEKFEHEFYEQLCVQHDRVDLFVRSKADELSRRMRDVQKKTIFTIAKYDLQQESKASGRRREKYSRLESKILDCGDEIKKLDRFIEAQQTAFRKILKKYKKWTQSPTLCQRFMDEVLNNPKSFTRSDLEPLKNQLNVVFTLIREVSPLQSEASTPLTQSRRESRQENHRPKPAPQMQEQQSYWNEYEHGSEAEDDTEAYTIYVDPDAEELYPGAEAMKYIASHIGAGVRYPIVKVKQWMGRDSPREQRPLLRNTRDGSFTPVPEAPSVLETDEPDDDASSSDFPYGYETHYATFPSIPDQKLILRNQRLRNEVTIASLFIAIVLLAVAGTLIATGRHRLRVEVDTAVIACVLLALCLGAVGFSTVLYRWAQVGWLQRYSVSVLFLVICFGSGSLLIMVMGNTSL